MTLETLERRVAALLGRCPRMPTLDEFKDLWDRADELSKSVLLAHGESPWLAVGAWERTVIDYLEQMGLVQAHYSLEDLIQ